MLKFIAIFAIVFLLSGCSSDDYVELDNEQVRDLEVSIYFAIEDYHSSDRWQNYISIYINSENEVVDIELNGISTLANSTRLNVAKLEGFADIFEYDFYQESNLLKEELIGLSKNELVEGMRNADDENINFDITVFINLANTALNSQPMEKGPFADGMYTATPQKPEVSMDYFVNLFVIHGHIKAVHFNAFLADHSLKYPVSENNYWREQASLFEEALLISQDFTIYTFDEEGLTTDIPGFEIDVKPFIFLVKEALASGPITH